MIKMASWREWFLMAIQVAVLVVSLFLAFGSKVETTTVAEARPSEETRRAAPNPVSSASSASRPSPAPIPAPTPAPTPKADFGELNVARLLRTADAREPDDAFASKSWYVPPPPPPPPPPKAPPPPTAPPLPFTYVGQYIEAGVPTFFLARGDRVLAVKVGDVLEGTYRVDGIEGSNLNLTYIPLDIRQTLDVGNAV